jgi:hypothetical protein
VLVAGGDTGGTLPVAGIFLSTSTVSSAGAEIYEALTDTFGLVGSMSTPREASATAVVLPNGKTLVAGGSHCFPNSFNLSATVNSATFSAGVVNVTVGSTTGFDAGQTLVVSGSSTAGNNGTFTVQAVLSATHFTYADAGGGACASSCGTATQNPETACGSGASFSGFECDALNTAELYTPTSSTAGSFTLAGSGSSGHMTTARSGATATLLANGTVLITGGSTGATFLGFGAGLTTPPVGCGPTGQVAQTTAEIYTPSTDAFTATASIPGCPAGTAPPTCTNNMGDALPAVCPGLPSTITTATESGTTVTITTPAPVDGLILSGKVEVGGVQAGGVNQPGYDGIFTVTGVSGNTFTYTAAAGLTSPASGGVAIAEGTAQCGLVDSAAALLGPSALVPNGVLVTGGDYITFLGQSSTQAFVYIPGGAGAWTAAHPMNVPRELPGSVVLPSGKVLLAGGLTGAAGACVGLPAACTGLGTPNGCCTAAGVGTTCGPTAIITNSSAEEFDPATFTWALTTGSSATPGAAGGMTTPRIATVELFKTGTDAGMGIVVGGINAVTPSFPNCSMATAISQTTTTATDLFDPTTTAFAGTGALNLDRGGYGFGILNNGPNSTDLVVIGGSCSTNGGLPSAPIGTAQATTTCGGGTFDYMTDYRELFSQGTGTWTSGADAPPATYKPAAAPVSALLP